MEEMGMGFGFLARPWLTSDRRLQFGRHIQLKADSSFSQLHKNGTKNI